MLETLSNQKQSPSVQLEFQLSTFTFSLKGLFVDVIGNFFMVQVLEIMMTLQ